MSKIILTTIIYFILTKNAYAYLDPGTGSIILSAIIAVLATIKHYWNLIKNFLNKKFLRKKITNKYLLDKFI